jgi:hypothetical protein
MLYNAQSNKNEDNIVKLFSMFASGNMSKAELMMKLKAKQELRLAKKRGPIDYTILDRNGDPITIVKAIDNSDALTKGMEWERSNPVSGGVRGVRLATPDDIKTVASRNEGQWSRWTVYDHDNNVLTYVSARNRQEASQIALRWGRENNRIIAAVDQDDGTVRIPSAESKEVVTELANQPYPYKVEDSWGNEFIAKFKTEKGLIYRVRVDQDFENPNNVGVSFEAILTKDYSEKTVTKTNTGDAFRIFATVGNILKIYLQKNPKVNQFYFSGNAKEPSRLKLYDSISKMIPKILSGWKLVKLDRDFNSTYYHFAKVNQSLSSLKEYIEVSSRPFIWQKEEPKKELTEMQKACILGGHEYTGELK